MNTNIELIDNGSKKFDIHQLNAVSYQTLYNIHLGVYKLRIAA